MDVSASDADERSTSESLTSRAFNEMRADIVSGILKPGSKLKIEALRKQYNLGASPIREALSLLTSTALVERLDQRGFRVAPIGLEDFEELLWTRCKLEAIALREAIARGGREWEEEVVLTNYRLSRLTRPLPGASAKAELEWEALHKIFHMSLLSACGSRYLIETCSDLYDHNVRYRQAAQAEASTERNVAVEHAAIASAAVSRQADKAIQLLEEHYHETGAYLRRALRAIEDAR